MDSQFDGPSEFPPFSSQSIGTTEGAKKKRGASFTIKEDINLVNSWLNTSEDSIHGNDQSSSRFWGRIHQLYHQYKEVGSDRDEKSLQQRWMAIQHATSKFCGAFAQIENLNPSGKNEQDKISDARVLFESTLQKKFTFDHCWSILRYHPKWINLETCKKQSTKKSRGANSSPGMSSSSAPDTPIHIEDDDDSHTCVERPPGIKAEKRKMKAREKNIQESPDVRNFMKEMIENRTIVDAAYLQSLEEKRVANAKRMEIAERQLMLKEEKERREKFIEDQKIMMMDTSGMNPEAQEYFKRLRMDIMAKMSGGSF